MPKNSSFEKAMEDLATAIAKDAAQSGTTLENRCEALKVLTPFYAARDKAKGKKPDSDDNESSFTDFAKEINGAEHGGQKVRSRAGRTDA